MRTIPSQAARPVGRPESAPPPEVSVVIPFHDASPFLDDAIGSVLEQDYTDWELILVDDASRDGSREIAERHATAQPQRIRVLDPPGGLPSGAGPSRDRGVEQARGRWLAFLDADDRWLPHKLGRQMTALAAHPLAAMTYGPSLKWYSWPGAPAGSPPDRPYDLSAITDRYHEAPSLVADFVSGRIPPPCPSSWLLRRSAYLEIGGGERPFGRGPYEVYEDQVLLLKLHLRYPVWVHSEVLDWYRKHADSVYERAKRAGEVEGARRRFLTWLVDYLEQRGLGTSGAAGAARRELDIGRSVAPPFSRPGPGATIE